MSSLGGFHSGSGVKNLPSNAGDMGSVPSLRGSHMLWSNGTQAPQLLKPACPRTRALQREESPQWGNCTPQLESSLCSPQLKTMQQPSPSTAKKWIIFLKSSLGITATGEIKKKIWQRDNLGCREVTVGLQATLHGTLKPELPLSCDKVSSPLCNLLSSH